MNPGKITCEILKKIRSEIAEANQIDYVTEPCTFKGSCIGTCPKCEAELQELEHQLAKKQGFPKTALIAGVTLSLLTGVTSCDSKTKTQDKVNINEVNDSITNLVSSPKDTIKYTYLDVAVRPKSKVKKQKYQNEIPVIQIINEDTNSSFYYTNEDLIDLCKPKFRFNYNLENKTYSLQRSPCGGVRPIPPDNFNNILYFHNNQIDFKSSSPQFEFQNEYLEDYLSKLFKYPENKIIDQRTIIVQMSINKSGKIKDVTILKSADPEIDQQIKKIFESMPNWAPGKDINGTIIDTSVKLKLKVSKEGIKVKKFTYYEVKIIK